MDKTPILQLLEYVDNKIIYYKMIIQKDTDHQTLKEASTYLDANITFKTKLQSMLEPERQFAETCFDAGAKYMRVNDDSEPDFETHFKQYTHE